MTRRTVLLGGLSMAALAQSPLSRDDRWRADYEFLGGELGRIHPNLTSKVPAATFEAYAADLLSRIPQLTDHEIVVAIARGLALVGDAHTNLNLPQGPIRQFPLRLYLFEEGVYATLAGAPYVRALGRRLLRIAGTPVDEVMAKVEPVISHENEPWLKQMLPGYLVSPEVLHAVGVLSSAGAAAFTFAEDDGAEFDLTVQPAAATLLTPHRPRPLNPLPLRNPALNYWYDYLPERRLLYIKYNRCQEAPALPFAAFNTEVQAFARANEIETLVFDLRHNAGGNSAIFQPLITGFRDLIRSRRAFAISGRQTFSSGMLNLIDLKRAGCVIVGEPTGGKPNAYGEVRAIQLPHSGLLVSCSTRLFTVPDQPGPSVPPDTAIAPTAADYFGERDAPLEHIFG